MAALKVWDGSAWVSAALANTPAASSVSFSPTGDIVATNAQAAIAEVDAEFHAHEVKTPGAHAASAISNTAPTHMTATDIQSVINALPKGFVAQTTRSAGSPTTDSYTASGNANSAYNLTASLSSTRRYEISMAMSPSLQAGTTAARWIVFLQEDGVRIGRPLDFSVAALGLTTFTTVAFSKVLTTSTASHTYSLELLEVTGDATFVITYNNTDLMYSLTILDIGAV